MAKETRSEYVEDPDAIDVSRFTELLGVDLSVHGVDVTRGTVDGIPRGITTALFWGVFRHLEQLHSHPEGQPQPLTPEVIEQQTGFQLFGDFQATMNDRKLLSPGFHERLTGAAAHSGEVRVLPSFYSDAQGRVRLGLFINLHSMVSSPGIEIEPETVNPSTQDQPKE
jgi:hypothetical protein